MALPPCHMFCQFFVSLPPADSPGSKPKLSCLMYQRSCDLGLGVPFNIASYALLTHMIALITDTEPHEFILQMGDAHVYRDHVEPLKTQLEREPRDFPKLKWARSKEEIGDIDGFKVDDFVVEGYKPWGKIDMKMSVSTDIYQTIPVTNDGNVRLNSSPRSITFHCGMFCFLDVVQILCTGNIITSNAVQQFIATDMKILRAESFSKRDSWRWQH